MKDDLVAKKLRTGEIAVWDEKNKSLILVTKSKDGSVAASVMRGAAFHAIRDVLGDVIQLQ